MTRPKGNRKRHAQVHTSKCGEDTLRGTARQIVDKYEALAVQALADKRDLSAQQYSQYAEHWRKVDREERDGRG